MDKKETKSNVISLLSWKVKKKGTQPPPSPPDIVPIIVHEIEQLTIALRSLIPIVEDMEADLAELRGRQDTTFEFLRKLATAYVDSRGPRV